MNISKIIIFILKQKPFFFSLILLLILSPSLSFADANKIFKENNKAVVVVVTFDEEGNPLMQGSGFVVRADGAIVTNYHVISNAVDIKVKAGKKVLDVEGLIHTDKENDLVILKAKGKNLPKVKLGDIEKTNIGDKVYVISSPEGLENTISDGILSGIRQITEDRKVLQITAPISSGSSGGAVFNENGEVIGITTFLVKEAQNLNFAMPVNLIKGKISIKKVTAVKDSEIKDYEKTAEYWSNLGYQYVESGKYREAIEATKQAIRINPDYIEAHFNLGNAYHHLGMYREAVEAFKQAVRLKPVLADPHYNLGVTYGKLGKHRKEIEAYKQAIRINPDYVEAQYNLGLAYGRLGKYREEIEAYKQTIRINPDYTKAHYNLGNAYTEIKMDREAVEAFKQAVRLKPDDVDAHWNLGISYLILNDRGSALEVYKILKELDTESANRLFNLIYK